jgi:hypothetical protein
VFLRFFLQFTFQNITHLSMLSHCAFMIYKYTYHRCEKKRLVHLRHGYCMLIHFVHGYYCIYRPWQPLTYLYFPYCISLIYFSFTMIRMFLYAQIYWLAEFWDVSCLQFNYLRVETLTPTWEDFVGQFGRTFVGQF